MPFETAPSEQACPTDRCLHISPKLTNGYNGAVKFILLLMIVVSIVLWLERAYWKRTAGLLESRLAGAEAYHGLIDTWLAGRSESRIRRKTRDRGAEG
jgi:hypothetical protein